MNIQQNRAPHSVDRALVLRDGNIVSGKILKVFPNEKAEIQIGRHKLIAKVTTPLTVGEQYFFQVQRTNQMVQLKVLGDRFKQDQTENIVELMQRLGLKITKSNVQFVQQLINEKIPFNREQIVHALQLLAKNISNREVVNGLLQKMIIQKIPLTDSIFNAFLAKETSTISANIQTLMNELQQVEKLTEPQRNLFTLLQHLSGRHIEGQMIQLYSTLDSSKKQLLYQILQHNGFIRQGMNFADLNAHWQQFINSSMENYPFSSSIHSPIEWNANMVEEFLTIIGNKGSIQSVANSLLQTYFPSFSAQVLTDSQFTTLKNTINNQLIPLLPEQTQHQLQSYLTNNNIQNSSQILQLLQMFTRNETFELFHALTALRDQGTMNQSQLSNQFLTYIQQSVASLGLTDEQQLSFLFQTRLDNVQEMVAENRQMMSIKAMLIQMIQQGNQSPVTERAQQLLHLINGLQLQSVHESPHLIQAMLQLPGERMGLHQDIFMQFEGKKSEDGKLDPNFCRILFMLHLHHLQETIVDMHVQKRTITMTIFNDVLAKETVKKYEEALHNSLGNLQYHLSTIRLKSLHDRNQQIVRPVQSLSKDRYSGEGIEFFI